MQEEKQLLPKLRFTEFEGEWEKKKFSNYIKLYRGSSPRPINRYLTDDKNGVNWIKIGDTKKVVNYTLENVSEKITVRGSSKSRRVKKGELILANSMSYGKTYLLGIDGCIYDGWFVLREYEFFFDKTFLIQQLNSEYLQKQYKRLSTGGVVQNISSEIVYSTYLCKPKINEQQKIANFLTAIDNRIQTLEKKKTILEQYKKGVMQKIFKQELRFKDDTSTLLSASDGKVFPEWEEKKLGQTGNIKKGKQLNKEELTLSGTYPCQNGGISPSGYTEEYNTVGNTITISEGGNSCGYVNYMQSKFWCGGHCYSILELKKEVNALFLFQYLKFNEYGIMRLRVGSGLPNIQKKDLLMFEVKLPCIEEQTKIANFLSAIDRNIELVTKKIEHTKTYKKGLLQQMFV
jgi:type I restriction enzyme S subunit